MKPGALLSLALKTHKAAAKGDFDSYFSLIEEIDSEIKRMNALFEKKYEYSKAYFYNNVGRGRT